MEDNRLARPYGEPDDFGRGPPERRPYDDRSADIVSKGLSFLIYILTDI